MAPPVLLIHGGLAEDMDAERFWVRPGVVAGLRDAGFHVAAPDRDTTPPSWSAAADAIALLMSDPTSIVAGSNGVSVAVRLAIQHRAVANRLILLWPATCGDPAADAVVPATARSLLAGDTLRGVADHELAALDLPVAVMPADPPNRFHATVTVERLLELVSGATLLPSFPETPRPEFARVRDGFVAALVDGLRT